MNLKEYPGSKANRFFLKNSRGQFAIESILLMSLLLTCFLAVTKYSRQNNLMSKLFQKPVESLAIMAEYGVWKSPDNTVGCKAPGKAGVTIGKCHPNSIARGLSSDPKP